MSIENGERSRVCPAKVARVRVPEIVFSPTSDVPGIRMVVPKGADVACDAACVDGPGLERRRLGPIPLPLFKETCPIEEARASDGHNLSMAGQTEPSQPAHQAI